MTMLQVLTEYTKENIVDNQMHLPNLHVEAIRLGLHPQPWWDRRFYDHAILRRNAEIELKGYEKQARKTLRRRTK